MGQRSKSDQIDTVKGCEYTDHNFVSIGTRFAEGIRDTGESPTANIKAINSKFVFCKLTSSQIENVMNKLINRKATGAHKISHEILKDSYHVIAPFLSDSFNYSISINTFPDNLKIGMASPAQKSGDRYDLSNYRPIPVLATVARVFERLLYN